MPRSFQHLRFRYHLPERYDHLYESYCGSILATAALGVAAFSNPTLVAEVGEGDPFGTVGDRGGDGVRETIERGGQVVPTRV